MPADTTIPVSDEVWERLMRMKQRGDTFDDVLRRELGLDEPRRQQPEPAETPDTLDDAIAHWQPPGEVHTAHARDALRDAVNWLDEHGGRATRSEIVAGARGDSPLGKRSWWERAVQPGLRELKQVEYRPGYHDYRVRKE